MAGDDAVELGQRLDLIDDDAAHLRGAVGGLLRQFEDAAAQLAAGRLRARAASRRPSAACPAASRRSAAWSARTSRASRRCAGCRCRAAARWRARVPAPARGRLRRSNSATMRAISRARPVAPSSNSSSRLEKRLSRCSMSSVRVSSVATSVSIPARRSPKAVVGAGGCSCRSARPLRPARGRGRRTGWRAGRGPSAPCW